MASQFVIPGKVDELGVLRPADLPRWGNICRALAGCTVEIVLRKPKSKRSLDQNQWWWGVAVPLIAEELGYDRHEYEAVHYALVSKCFGVRQDAKLGEVPNKRSSQLTIAEFSELMEWAVRFAATEIGIALPMPGETEAAAA